MGSDAQGPLAEAATDPLVGKIVQERYRILRKLGQGGMGAVYLAEHELIRKRVALKCLHPALASSPEAVRRFHQEAVAATAIGHPHIVDVTDMGRFEDGSVFMVLEFLQGRDWQHDLNGTGPQPLERVAHIALQVCDALAAAGRKGIVHRDLKPENIFLIERHGDPDFVKVLDFGISKVQSEQGSGTKTGAFLGTPSYMAPEQVRGASDIDQQADVYSMGVVLYQALSGQLPLTGATLLDLIVKISTDTPQSLADRVPGIPPEVARLVDGMLRKEPTERPRGFDEVSAVLKPFESAGAVRARSSVPPSAALAPGPVVSNRPAASELGVTAPLARPAVSAPPPPPALRSATRSVSPWLLGGLGVGLLALVIGFATLPRNDAPPVAPLSVPENPRLVRVQISTVPPDAELTLDGKPITNPFDGQLTWQEQRSSLRATHTGFEPSERNLVLSSEQRIFIQLTPVALAPEAKGSSAPPPAKRSQPTPTNPAAVALESEPAPPAPAAAQPPSAVPQPAAQETPKPALKKVF